MLYGLYSAGTLVVPGLAYKLFIIRARRDEDVARTMWSRDSDRDRNRERCPRGGEGVAATPI